MQHLNTFTNGMKRGIDYTIIPQDTYMYMLNGCLVSKDDKSFVITSIKGTNSIAEFNNLEAPIGSVEFNGILYIITHKIIDSEPSKEVIRVYSIKGSNGSGWVDTMEIVPNGPDDMLEIPQELLGFGRERLLQVFAKEGYDGTVDMYLCDGLSPNAIINTGIDRDGKKAKRQYKEFVSKEQFSLFKSVTKVPDATYSIKDGGSLKPGTYYMYIRYEDETLNTTPFVKEVGPIIIHAGDENRNNAFAVRNENDIRVSKKIVLKIKNADKIYNRVSVGVVFYFGVDGILSRENFLIDMSYSVNDGSCTVTFDGTNAIRSLLIEDIVNDNMEFNISETHLQLENRYYGANWSRGNVNFDKLKEMARRIIPRSVLDKEDNFDNYHDEKDTKMEYMEGEIYPFGVSFLIDGRFKTPVFPVCGWREGYKKYPVIQVPDLPLMTLSDAAFITASSFRIQFIVDVSKDYPVSHKGIIWKKNTVPTWSNKDGYVEYAMNPYPLTIDINNLDNNSLYYYRIYIKFANGKYAYGVAKSITTQSGLIELVTYGSPENIKATRATCFGYVNNINGSTISEKGICYSKVNAQPTISDSKKTVAVGSGTGSIEAHITGLDVDTKYYYRAYATNELGTTYGSVYDFTTLGGALWVATIKVSNISPNSAQIDGYIVDGNDSGATAVEKGACWSKLPNPTIELETKTVLGGGIGEFDTIIYGLDSNEHYYVRAYAISSIGGIVSYGQQLEFTTEP